MRDPLYTTICTYVLNGIYKTADYNELNIEDLGGKKTFPSEILTLLARDAGSQS